MLQREGSPFGGAVRKRRREREMEQCVRIAQDTLVRGSPDHTGREVPLPGVHLEEGVLPLQGQKVPQEPLAAKQQQGQRHMQMADYLVAAFCCAPQ